MGSEFQIRWTDEAIHNIETIIDFIKLKWTEKEVNEFKRKLIRQIEIIQQFPTLFPISPDVPRLRKAVVSKQTSLFYEVKDMNINIIYIFNTR
jgi:plasmid stabilization system protein ParE